MKFRCKVTGNTVEFTQEVDIKAMLRHHQYEVVEDKEIKKELVKEVKTKSKE
jgi:hypothetical protein